ncbi:MAG: hypothetical protein ACT443_07335 [Gemmatimonadota bacterium]
MPPTIEVRAERLLTALAGVVSARAVADELGRLCEIHILASPDLHPKQIVRNVESALSAGLGVIVDRRIVSVAQLRPSAAASYVTQQKKTARVAARAAARQDDRAVYLRYELTAASSLGTSCQVTLRRGEDHIQGLASGVNTPQGRAEIAARAVFDALQQGGEGLGLEGTVVVQAQGKSYVLVSARAVSGRTARILTGVAAVQRSPEEAAILAALQATNRLAPL